jgi:hypothetical protein
MYFLRSPFMDAGLWMPVSAHQMCVRCAISAAIQRIRSMFVAMTVNEPPPADNRGGDVDADEQDA